MKVDKHTIRKVIKVIALNAIFVLFLYYVIRRFKDFTVNPVEFLTFAGLPLAGSILAFCIFYLLLSIAWVKVFALYTSETRLTLVSSFFASQLFKYLPTSIFSFSSRVGFSKGLGFSAKDGIRAVFLENAFIVTSSVMIFLLFGKQYLLSFLLLASIGLAFVIYKKYNERLLTIRYLAAFLPRKDISLREYLTLWLLYLGAWLSAGIALLFLATAMGFQNLDSVNYIAFQALSYTLSILAVFSPGGIGVREFVLLMSTVPEKVILYWRLLTFGLDIILGTIGIVWYYLEARKHRRNVRD